MRKVYADYVSGSKRFLQLSMAVKLQGNLDFYWLVKLLFFTTGHWLPAVHWARRGDSKETLIGVKSVFSSVFKGVRGKRAPWWFCKAAAVGERPRQRRFYMLTEPENEESAIDKGLEQ